MRTQLFIDGEWVDGTGGTIEVLDPATEETLATVQAASAADAVAAVDAAARAAHSWAATAPRDRGELLRRCFELMLDRADAIAELIVRENGKSFSDAIGEVRYGAEFFRWFSEEAVRVSGEVRRAPGGEKMILTLSQPVGISFLVTPWNFPLSMGTRKIGPALAAGCTVILKPASDTPLTSLYLADLMTEVGLPPGVVNVISARGSSGATDVILEDPRVRKLSFTGSTEVGRVLLAKASQQVLRTSMELGGNAPFIVCADADLEAAVDGAMVAKMRNGGEACTAANRFYVEAPVADEFSRRLAEAMAQLQVGPGLDRTSQVGPLINAPTRQKVDELVHLAADHQGRVLTGGRALDRKGFFYEPTVITDVLPDSPILRYEIFGPVAPVVSFDTIDRAIAMANDTEYGLIAYVYAGDLGKAMGVAERLESGMVGINRGLVSDPAAPFGGVKQSGIGREGSSHGVAEYLETKYIAADW